MTCEHQSTLTTDPRCFDGPVAFGEYETRSAHGSITYVEHCNICGAERGVNQNRHHIELGEWREAGA